MKPKELAKYLYCALGTDKKPVGINFLHSRELYQQSTVPEVRSKISYCSMVKLTTLGNSFKTCLEKSLCPGATRALGLEKPDDLAKAGKRYYRLGMYDSLCTAKNVYKNANLLDHEVFGIQVQPLEKCEDNPDVVLLILNPYQAMRVIQGYTYHFGLSGNIRLSGNQGVCLECTARPYETNDINISMLCSNTRFSAKWRESELGLGIPFNKFDMVVDGIIKTINPSETDLTKVAIKKRADELGIDLEVTMGSCYYRIK